MSCTKCKGKGHIKKDIPITLNWITSIIGFIVGPFYMEHRTYEKKPGKVAEIITCPKCKGKGHIKKDIPITLNWITSILGFIIGPFYMEHRTYEKRPGKIAEVTTCSKCKGTGR